MVSQVNTVHREKLTLYNLYFRFPIKYWLSRIFWDIPTCNLRHAVVVRVRCATNIFDAHYLVGTYCICEF